MPCVIPVTTGLQSHSPLSISVVSCLAGRLHRPAQDAVDRHGGAPEVPARHPPDPSLPPPLPLPSLLTVLPLEQTSKHSLRRQPD